jgi:hypothetical protein
MGEWVLIWMIYQGSVGTTVIAPPPIYFHDQAACTAVAKKLADPANEQFTMDGKCYPTRTPQEVAN